MASVIPAAGQKLRRSQRPSQLKANGMPSTRNIRCISALSPQTMLSSAGGWVIGGMFVARLWRKLP
jgi:hypothetical protein